MTTTNQQLELGLNHESARMLGQRRETRIARAQWWFTQMRAAVTGTMTWPPAGQPAGEQIVFPDTAREARA